jgi:hypothetical protein
MRVRQESALPLTLLATSTMLVCSIALSAQQPRPVFLGATDLVLRSSQAPVRAADVFRLNAQANYSATTAALAQLQGHHPESATFLAEIRRGIVQWPLKTGPAFALEAAAALVTDAPTKVADTLDLARNRVDRLTSKDPFQLAWYHAAVCVYQSTPQALLQCDLPADDFLGNKRFGDFLEGVRTRHPDDPILRMAWAVLHEQRLYLEFWGNAAPTTVGLRSPKQGGWTGPSSEKQLRAAADLFKALQSEPSLHDEATLRLGLVVYQQQDVDRAMASWAAVDAPGVASRLRYLSKLFTGQAMIEAKRPADASVRLREALELFPGAQSAGVPLVSLEYLGGHAVNAAALADRLLRSPAPDDPWFSYFFPDLSSWQARVAALRRLSP